MNNSITYLEANAALNDVLLASQRYEDRNLYLQLSSSVRKLVASRLSVKEENVEKLICHSVGRYLNPKAPYFDRISEKSKRWRVFRPNDLPPSTAFLFAMSQAASLMAADGDFGGGNFYDRLNEVLGKSFGNLGQYGRLTEVLWLDFNQWLVDNDFIFGRPTAHHFNAFKYVNYPQTQAIIRAGDRHRFHSMFERYGLIGGGIQHASDLKPYIESWIHTAESNDRLRAAWQKPDIRARFLEVVFSELDEWSEGSADFENNDLGKGASQRRFLLGCFLKRGILGSRLEPFLFLGSDRLTPTISAKGPVGQSFGVQADLLGGVATVSPPPFKVLPRLMSTGLILHDDDRPVDYSWTPRTVIPLQRSQLGSFWSETTRTTVMREHIVLVKNLHSILSDAEAYLQQASPTARKILPGQMKGLPEGWVLFRDVRIIRPDLAAPNSVSALQPVEESISVFELFGGTRVGRDAYSIMDPPSLRYLAAGCPTRLRVKEDGSNEPMTMLEENSMVRSIEVSSNQLKSIGPGRFRAITECNGKKDRNALLLMRTADKPRPRGRSNVSLKYVNSVNASNIHLEQKNTPHWQGSAPRLNPDFLGQQHANPCVERGYHIWICETVDLKNKPEFIRQDCNGCKRSELTSQKERIKIVKDKSKKGSRISIDSVPEDTHVVLPHNAIIDGLAYLGEGSLADIERLLANNDIDPWIPSELAHQYSALGFIRVALKPGTGRIDRWEIEPSRLLQNGEQWTLTGFRSPKLLNGLASVLDSTNLKIEAFNGQPDRITICNISEITLREICIHLEEALGISVEIVPNSAQLILNEALSAECWHNVLVNTSIALQDIEKVFDPQTAIWKSVTTSSPELKKDCAIRAGWAGRTYAFRQITGETWQGPHQLVKLLSAISSGQRLHSYEEEKEQFVSVLGAEPLGLLARALVAPIGRLPEKRGKYLTYKCDSPKIGHTLISLLYSPGGLDG